MMEDTNLWAIWHSELKMWLRTGKKYREYTHTREEVAEWIKSYEKDRDKDPDWLYVYNVDNIIKNFIPLQEERAEA